MEIDNNKDTQSRKWLLTINNPKDKNIDYEFIKSKMNEFKSCVYYCMSQEIGGSENTHHIHLYMVASSGIRFSTVKNKFPESHIDNAYGTSKQNREYVFKEGKWRNTEKETTNLKNTHYEWGEMPVEHQGRSAQMQKLFEQIKSGASNYEIIADNPENILNISNMDRARFVIKTEEFMEKERDIDVTYIYGGTGLGKSSSIFRDHGYKDVYRVTDYKHPFDGYQLQEIIVFEEFHGQLPIGQMLNYLDIYPLELPARYSNKVACYTKAYIVSNLRLNEQYEETQLYKKEIWNAFLRRIKTVREFVALGEYNDYPMDEYKEKLEFEVVKDKDNPFI